MANVDAVATTSIRNNANKLLKNVLNFRKGSEDTPIYRIMHVEELLDILDHKYLHLKNPSRWDDPFENYILKELKRMDKLNYRADMFGLCWSLNPETDAMWRIYAPDKRGVKVKTTVHKLIAQMYQSEEAGSAPYLSCFIGKVDYVNSKELKKLDEHLENIVLGEGSSRGVPAVKTLLKKRVEFKHEAEVRLVYVDHSNHDTRLGKGMAALLPVIHHESHTFKFKIDPFELIDEIVLDPRMNDYTCSAYTDFINKIGYNKPITQSSLYKLE